MADHCCTATDAVVYTTQDYYSHTVFEFVENVASPTSAEDNSSSAESNSSSGGGIAVLAGGCYDNLSEMLGGPPVSCIGWAAGVDRLHLLRNATATPADTIAVVPVLIGDDHDAVLHEAMRIAHVRCEWPSRAVVVCLLGSELRAVGSTSH